MITIQDIINKRKARWEERHDIDYDNDTAPARALGLCLQ